MDYQDVQVKSAVDMLDLEWKAVLPGNKPFPQMTERSIVTDKSHKDPIELIDTKVATKVVVVTENPSNYIYPQLQDVRNAIKIPDKKSKRDHEIISVIKNILQDRIPSSKAIPFRNWYLNMKNFTTSKTDDPLLVYVYSLDESPTQCNSTFLSGSFIKRYLTGEKFTCLSSKKTHLGLKFIYKPSNSFVFVVNSKQAMAEVQLSQLAKYYFDFDTRVRPIFYLAQYWKITNGIQFGQTDVPAKIYRKCLPEPYCLYWILITFLIHENILPSVRTILERPHKSIIDQETGADIGFHEDPQFASQWKVNHKTEANTRDKFVMTVLQLFNKFLEFCSMRIIAQGRVIINPKDGEILDASQVLQGNATSKLSPEEISSTCANLKDNSSCCWYMIHPLITEWRFSAPEKNLEHVTSDIVKKTNEKFKDIIKLIEVEGAEKAFQICGESLCEILKVDSDRLLNRKRHIDEDADEEDEGPCSNKEIKIKNHVNNPVVLLKEYAQKKKWKLPSYSAEKVEIKRDGVSHQTKYLYTVEINGRTFKQSCSIGSSVDENVAKAKAAQFCLERLEILPQTFLSPQIFCSKRKRRRGK